MVCSTTTSNNSAALSIFGNVLLLIWSALIPSIGGGGVGRGSGASGMEKREEGVGGIKATDGTVGRLWVPRLWVCGGGGSVTEEGGATRPETAA